jgi:hypothetical protein
MESDLASDDRFAPTFAIRVDRQFVGDLFDITTLRVHMPAQAQMQLDHIIKHDVIDKFDCRTWTMTSHEFRTAEGELSQKAGTLSGSPVAAHRQVGDALLKMLEYLRQLRVRNNLH